ncbi:MAG: KH domain-containing protein [Anaerolineales bacterium]|nr:KH domain-containing protein [Anaerolineales bacterium]MCS7246841.1 KH domain-containing protein [Anaerolineales bacterium]MDW8160651.1 KH domain-containing protein [Anaerolineales bacterium]MDW8445741.1 KH domain-containing protein [Anaerolineales bacterium]
MKSLVEYVARSLVDSPNEVSVREVRRGSAVNVILRVAKSDMGRVIGKNGRVANALRVLLKVAAARQGLRATLDVEEPR